MKTKNVISRGLSAIMLVLLVSSFSVSPVAKKFNPVGTWDYEIMEVPPEYAVGFMIIEKADDGIAVSMGADENYRMEGEDVEYNKKKKSLTFTLHVEYEAVTVSGTFEKDTFSGTVSLSQGEFDIKGNRRSKK